MPAQAPNAGRSLVPIAALLLSVALLILGYGLQATLIGMRATHEGISTGRIGTMMSAYYIGFGAASIAVVRLVYRVGHIRTFAALAAVSSAAALGYVLSIGVVSWTLLRALQGACYGGMVVVIESWLNGSTNRDYRGRVLAFYQVIVLGAWALSQFLIGLGPVSGFTLFCLCSIIISLSMVPITLTKTKAPPLFEPTATSVRHLYRRSPVGVGGAFVSGLSFSAFVMMGPPFLELEGADRALVPLFMSLPLFGGLLFQWPVGWMSDVVDRRKVISGCTLAASIASAAVALYGNGSIEPLLIAVFFFGAASIPVYSICAAQLNDSVPESELVSAASSLLLVYGVGSILGPMLGGAAMTLLGPGALFGFIAAAHSGYLLLDIYWVIRRRMPTIRRPFAPVPRTTFAALPLDDRLDPQVDELPGVSRGTKGKDAEDAEKNNGR